MAAHPVESPKRSAIMHAVRERALIGGEAQAAWSVPAPLPGLGCCGQARDLGQDLLMQLAQVGGRLDAQLLPRMVRSYW